MTDNLSDNSCTLSDNRNLSQFLKSDISFDHSVIEVEYQHADNESLKNLNLAKNHSIKDVEIYKNPLYTQRNESPRKSKPNGITLRQAYLSKNYKSCHELPNELTAELSKDISNNSKP